MTDSDVTFESFGLSGSTGRNECANLVGQTIDGRYTLLRQLGEGGFGCVFLAQQKSPNREVAVKVQKHAGRESHRMAKEADLLARLDDRGIARVFEAGDWASPTGSRIFVAMELISGGIPLHNFCRDRRLSVRDRLVLFREVCRAVSVAHREGIIHRDLKPGNILVDKHGQPRVIDFGISKLVASGQDQADGSSVEESAAGPDQTRAGAFLGTPPYAALEQQGGEATTRSDVHALGMILKEDLFTDLEGRLPAWLAPLVARCTAGDPQLRPGNAAEMMADLERLQSRTRRRRLIAPLAVAASILIAVGTVANLFFGEMDEPRTGPPSLPPRPLVVQLLDEGRIAAGDPAGRRLATAIGKEVVLSAPGEWNKSEQRLVVAATGALGIAFGAAGSIVAASDAVTWRAWDLNRRAIDSRPIFELHRDASASSDDGLIAVSPNGGTVFAQSGPRRLLAYTMRTGQPAGLADIALGDPALRITALAPAATANAAFVGLSDGSLRRWMIKTGTTVSMGQSHGLGPVLLAANADATRLAACGSNGVVHLLDGGSAGVVATSEAIPGILTAICITKPDDVVVASRLRDGNTTVVLQLSSAGGKKLVVSGTATVPTRVTSLAFTGSDIIAIGQDPKEADAALVSEAARRSGS